MRSPNSVAAVCAVASALLFFGAPGLAGTFVVPAHESAPWSAILASAGHIAATQSKGAPVAADIYVAPRNAPASADYRAKVMGGAAMILEGSSPLASSFGFTPGSATVSVIHIVDEHNPALPVVWSRAVDIPRYDMPAGAHVFAKERWSGAPVIAGYHLGSGAVLWIAASPGANGYERFPYLMQALADLGFGPVFPRPRGSGRSSIIPIARAPIPTISPHTGAPQASAPCMPRHGIFTIPTPPATNICAI